MNTACKLAAATLCLLLWPAALRAAEQPALKVVTSFLPAYCFSVNVAGGVAEVENLLPAAVGPHEYQFSPRDLGKLAAADVIVVNGLQLEAWLDKAIETAAPKKAPLVVECAGGLREELISDRLQQANPHLWLDPLLAAHAVTNISRALQRLDAAHAEDYARNARHYVARLKQLDGEIRASVASFKQRNLVTYHNAFPYFARRYELKVVEVVEEVPDVEPSPQHVRRLLGAVREHGLKALFVEPQFSSRLAGQLARDLGVAVAELDTLETGPLTATAYEDGMRRNLRALEQYLK